MLMKLQKAKQTHLKTMGLISNLREVFEVEVAGHKANIIQWKRSIAISEIVIKALEEKLKTMPKPKEKEKKKPLGVN